MYSNTLNFIPNFVNTSIYQCTIRYILYVEYVGITYGLIAIDLDVDVS